MGKLLMYEHHDLVSDSTSFNKSLLTLNYYQQDYEKLKSMKKEAKYIKRTCLLFTLVIVGLIGLIIYTNI
jgi:hypothetical protein